MRFSVLQKAFLVGVLVFGSNIARSDGITVIGIGKAPITADVSLTRDQSLRAAKRDAIIAAVNQINGSTASDDPKVVAAIDMIVKQIGDDQIADVSTRRDGANNFVTTLKLNLDDKAFRKLISDAGIAIKTANSFPILVVMDEYFTSPTDHSKPLREVVDLFVDKSAHHVEDHSDSQASSSQANSRDQSQFDAHRQRETYINAYDGVAADGARTSASGSQNSSSESKQNNKLDSSSHEDEGQKNVLSYHSMVEYQPQQTTPSQRSYTYEAILREASSYDLNILDNSLFRSRYFTGKPLTMDELKNSPELARYVDAARNDVHADYFMMGSSIIYDMGKDPSIGKSICDGVVTIKAFSTADSKILATDARSESASGDSADQCRVNVANKLASFTASTLARQIQEYWKNRNEYGQQYNVALISLLGQLNFRMKNGFRQTISQLRGLKDAPVERQSDGRTDEFSIQYASVKPIADAIGELLSGSPVFSAYPNFDIQVKGTSVRVCLESTCPLAQ